MTGPDGLPALDMPTGPLPAETRNPRLYRGDILLFRQSPALRVLLVRLHALAVAYLGPEPQYAHSRFAPDDLGERAEALRKTVVRDPGCREMLHAALAEAGVEPDRTYRDLLKLRVQPPLASAPAEVIGPLAAHRDTWGSNVMAQVNWWAPVCPVTPARTIALFPSAFTRPVANSSPEWDLGEVIRRRKAGEALSGKALTPVAEESVDWRDALALTPRPGDLLAFSGAHLHASVPNTSDETRLSLEVRTVDGPDAAQGLGAPNVDGRAPRIAWHWFRRLDDRAPLGEMG